MLDEMINFFLSFRGEGYNCNISFVSYVQYPLICNYHFLPTDYKNKIADNLLKSSKNYSDSYIRKELEGHVTNLNTNTIDDGQRKNLSKAFIRYNDQQDKFRKSSTWRALLPELETALTKSVG